jgi:serine/threonine protein kinase/Tol biopolymer transport system component
MSLRPGTRLGAYEITGTLGAGGMGEVYRARDRKLSRDVALKILPELFARDPDRRARFEREATVLASLNHPNIGAIYGFEETEETSALVLELVDGETLADRITRGPIPLEEALPIARQICEALEAAHEHGIVHRDLKPANVKLRSDGVVKVLDFGLAKALKPVAAGSKEQDPAYATSLSPTITTPAATAMGVIMGTAAYMSPDQARGKPADKRADLWAFGCVLYEMLTGRRAFESSEVSDTLALILMKEPDWRALPPTIPPGIRTLLRRSLEKDRKRRLADASDARLEIEEALAPSGGDTVSPLPLPIKGRSRIPWWIAAFALVAIAALAVPTVLYLTQAPPEPLLTRLDVVTPATTDAFSFAISPDGRQLVFVATEGGRSRLWVRALDQAIARTLPGTDGANWPFWSPDGHAVGFFADGKLKRINLGGGAPQELAVALQARGATWNAADVIVFAPTATGPLMQVPARGGTPAAATQLSKGQGSHRWPQFFPDGRRFIFSVALGQLETRGVYLASLDGGEPKRLLSVDTSALYAPPGFLLYVSNDALVAHAFDESSMTVVGDPQTVAQGVGIEEGMWRGGFSVSAAGVVAHRTSTTYGRQLAWADRTGKVLRTMRPGADASLGTIAHPSIAANGRHIALAMTAQGNPDIWLTNVDSGVTSRFTTDPAVDFSPVWKPDGTLIVFRSSRNGVFDLFEKPADSAGDERLLLASQQNKSATDWSRDGRVLLYAIADPKTQSDLWALPMTEPTDARKPLPVVQTMFDEIQGQFSPDGRWIAYASNESGRYDIFVKPFPEAGGRFVVSTAGGTSPRWSRDGRELFYVAADYQLMAVPMKPGKDPRTLIAGAPVSLFATHLAAGGNLPPAGYNSGAQFSVTLNGQFLMNMAADDAVTSPITLILNWTAALKK